MATMELVPLDDFNATMYRISTMTVTGSVNTNVNLKKFFDLMDVSNYDNIKYVEYGATKNEQDFKGERSEKNKKNKVKKRFDNQMTLHMYDTDYKYNVKLFKNGNVQMTGVKDADRGRMIIDELIKTIKIINKIDDDHEVLDDVDNKISNINYNTRLINCDFRVSYKINRGNLHKLLNTKYNLTCSYEPCIYQGVKVAFYMNNYSNDGICRCPKKCLGKGPNTICKKITVAVFQSGCVTITGSTTINQLEYVYEYMKTVLEQNIKEVYQQTYKIAEAA
jgi:TATA-box binding protein (TBP) (component of TFIID and TFIIIB)